MEQLLLFMAHHWFLWCLLIAISGSLIFLELRGSMNGIPQLSPQQVTDLINHQHAIVIDIRSPEDFSQGHIVDAKNIPTSQFEQQKNKLESYKTKSVIVVCNRGRSSNVAAVELKKMGFNQLGSLVGGMTAWRELDLPVVKGEG